MRLALIVRGASALCAVVLMAGCVVPVTEESLDDANVVGDPPPGLDVEFSSSSSSFADMFFYNIAWEPITDAVGYQLQRDSDYDDSGWSTVEASDDATLYVGPEADGYMAGYEETAKYRVRAVFEGEMSEVSPWSDEASITTPKGNLLYEVTGTASSASITMRTNTGTEQADISVPLKSKSGTSGLWGQATNMTPYLSAQATDDGSITCRITRKGVVVSENTSSGYGSIATCAP